MMIVVSWWGELDCSEGRRMRNRFGIKECEASLQLTT